MIKLLIHIILLFPSYFVLANSFSTENSNYNFKKIGIEEGLSQSSISSIVQDSRGYIWFGTATGLNRYDGYEFVIYQNDFNDSLSISDNDITELYQDKNGFLWIGTTDGILNKFDPLTETFEHFDIAKSSEWYSLEEQDFYNYPLTFTRYLNSTITSITEDKQGFLWIATWGKGLVKFNPSNGAKRYYYHLRNNSNSLSSNKIVSLLNDNNNNLWIGTFGGGLNRVQLNLNNSEDILFEKFYLNSKFLFGTIITSIIEDSENNIWIGGYSTGVFKIPSKIRIKSEAEITSDFQSSSYISKLDPNIFNVMALVADKNSNIWVGTYGKGLFAYFSKSNNYKHFIAETNNPKTISENEIQSLFVDNSGILWIGTQLSSGINKLEIGNQKFNKLPTLTEKNKSLNDNIVWALHEDREDNIWIGTHRGGVNIWNKNNNEISYFRLGKGDNDKHIKCFTEDKKGNIWVGSYSGGLFYINITDNSIKNFKKNVANPRSISSNHIQSLLIEGDSVLWLATYGGLNKLNLNEFYNSSQAEFLKYNYHPTEINSISDDRVYSLFIDSKNVFWVGTNGGGLNKFDRVSKTFTRYKSAENKLNSLSDDRILTISEKKDGNLIIGTFGGGINLYDRKNDRFSRINDKLQLNCSDIYGILNDESGYWISTNNGIFKLNEELSSFTQYDLSDGLQSLEFSGGAYLKGRDGTFYFGGINGVNYFNPSKITSNNFIPPIVISRVKVFDKPIKGEKNKLVFGKDENYFSFEFASLDFKNSNKNKYKFILDGLDTKWSFTDANNRRVFYTNLAPGNYTFRVMGTNDDGIWSPNEAKIEITILGPFWMQWWFISGLILLIGGLITFYINQRIKYLLALDRLKSSIAADLHDNVGAGLTEISILSELATNEINQPNKATRHIGKISDLSRQLVESMSDIVWVVNPSRASLYDLIVRLKDMYGDLLVDLGIKLKTSNLEKLVSIKLPMDYRQDLYLILKESINNCIKHSKCKNINLLINISKNTLNIKLSDDGTGFSLEDKILGNGLNNIKTRGKKIGGIVNIHSELNVGTTIEFEGKINK
ncbi:MAG: triple tyrosine motif-containing protein [Melioribacteraceae bacterium]|nr:triple tyrosine motif-containing protein [Melioribacteraceae bacterium]